jgi:hypothetical protein
MMNGFPTVKTFSDTGRMPPTRNFEDLPAEQKAGAEQMLNDARFEDIYRGMADTSKAVNAVGELIGGIESDDLEFSHNPATGRTHVTVSRDVLEEVAKAQELGTAERPFMPYQRMADDEEGNPRYGFDFTRLITIAESAP